MSVPTENPSELRLCANAASFRLYGGAGICATGNGPQCSPMHLALIRRMSTENVLRGAPRIRSERALLGHETAESTVAKYRVKHQDPKRQQTDPKRQQTWRTFLANHMNVSAGCDFFTVPTLTFGLLETRRSAS